MLGQIEFCGAICDVNHDGSLDIFLIAINARDTERDYSQGLYALTADSVHVLGHWDDVLWFQFPRVKNIFADQARLSSTIADCRLEFGSGRLRYL